HSITAVYNDDANFSPGSSSILTQTVDKASSTSTLASSANPVVFGQPVIFTNTVSAVSPGAGTPTGTVTFNDGATPLATNTLSSGKAIYTNAALAVGSHSITAVYNGDGNFNTSTNSPLTQMVNQSPSTTALTSSTNPTVFGQSVTFTAAVTGTNGTATGTVTFKDGATSLSTNTLVSGQAAFTTSTFSVTNHSITAI